MSLSPSVRIAKYVYSFGLVRAVLAAVENCPLSTRTYEDQVYNTNTYADVKDSITQCIRVGSRVRVRPFTFLSRLFLISIFLYDWGRLGEKSVVLLESNAAVRNAFRNISASDFEDSLILSRASTGNNHRTLAAARNIASNVLASLDVGDRLKFSLGGAKREMDLCDGGYRGAHQLTDFSHELRKDQVLSCHPSLAPNPDIAHDWLIVSTDVINHVPAHDRRVILSNGIPMISYTTSANCSSNSERAQYWEGNALKSIVNGGGTYTDTITEDNGDVRVINSIDGGLMVVYVDRIQDPFDRTHMLLCETPICYVARSHPRFAAWKPEDKTPVVRPLTVKTPLGTASCLSLGHARVIQITDNTTHETLYYSRAVLAALANSSELGMKTKFRLQDDDLAPEFKTSPLLRYELLQRIGTSLLPKILKDAPQISQPQVPAEQRNAHVGQMLTELVLSSPHFSKLCELWTQATPAETKRLTEKFHKHGVKVPAVEKSNKNKNDPEEP